MELLSPVCPNALIIYGFSFLSEEHRVKLEFLSRTKRDNGGVYNYVYFDSFDGNLW